MTPGVGDFFLTTDAPERSTLSGALFSTLIKWGTGSAFNHAGVYVGGDCVVEAQPGGARLGAVGPYLGGNTVWSYGYGIPDDGARTRVSLAAYDLVGTPYGWPDIIAITLAQKRLGKWQVVRAETPEAEQPWWVRRLARTDRLICSELVDLAYCRAGVHLFDDKRVMGLVSPGDLGRLIGRG